MAKKKRKSLVLIGIETKSNIDHNRTMHLLEEIYHEIITIIATSNKNSIFKKSKKHTKNSRLTKELQTQKSNLLLQEFKLNIFQIIKVWCYLIRQRTIFRKRTGGVILPEFAWIKNIFIPNEIAVL